jgi:hypothetical protein
MTKKTYPPTSAPFQGVELDRVRLDGDAARAVLEAARLAGLRAPFGPTREAEGVIRYALELLQREVDSLDGADPQDVAEFAARLRLHSKRRRSRAQLVHDAEEAAKHATWAADDERRAEAEAKRQAAEDAIRAEEEAEREARVQARIASGEAG